MAEGFKFIDCPEVKWRCRFCGVVNDTGGSIVLECADAPNVFWRWMQLLVFGFRWERTG